MPETAARRPLALAGTPPAAQTRVTAFEPCTRFVLRVSDADRDPPAGAAGFDLSGPLNSCRVAGEQISVRLGPDEWLLIAPQVDAPALFDACIQALAGRTASLVDVSHRNVALAVSGPGARSVLNAGIALDLSDAAFPAGAATRTLMGKADVVLLRTGAAPVYRVECWRSFGPYVHGLLTEVAQEFA